MTRGAGVDFTSGVPVRNTRALNDWMKIAGRSRLLQRDVSLAGNPYVGGGSVPRPSATQAFGALVEGDKRAECIERRRRFPSASVDHTEAGWPDWSDGNSSGRQVPF